MYGREEGQELNFNWDIMSISYNINHYYSVLSLSTPMSASGTSLPACVEWRTARRERAAWWRWAVKPLQADSAHSHLQGKGGAGKWQLCGHFTAGQCGTTFSGPQGWYSLALPRVQSLCLLLVYVLEALGTAVTKHSKGSKSSALLQHPAYETNCGHVVNIQKAATVSLSAILKE